MLLIGLPWTMWERLSPRKISIPDVSVLVLATLESAIPRIDLRKDWKKVVTLNVMSYIIHGIS